jgi:hypothetical protein
MLVIAFINGRFQRDFAQEWSSSLRVSRLRRKAPPPPEPSA